MKTKPKKIKVCHHCREPFFHNDGCLFFEARKREARRVRRNERTFEVDGDASDFENRTAQNGGTL